MLTRNRALLGFLAATLATGAGCDFDGSNTPPQSEPDLTVDGAQPDAPSTSGNDTAPAHDAAATPDAASFTGVTVDGSIADSAEEAATIDAGPADAGAVAIGVDVATQTEVEAGIDATANAGIDGGVDASPTALVDGGDSATIGAATGPVAMTITGPAGPESGVLVVFHDPYGNQIGVVPTDTTGAAAMTVQAGSMVTAIFGTPDQSTLVTFAAVQPGDVIPLVDPTQRASVSASPTIQAPAAPVGATELQFIVADGCSAQTASDITSASVDIDSACVGPDGLFPILVLGTDEGGSVLGFTFQDDNPIGEGGSSTVTLTGPFSSSLGTETIETTSTDPDGLTPYVATVRQIADGVSYSEPQRISVNEDGSSQTITTLEPGFASAVQTEVDLVGDVSLVAVVSHEPAPSQSGTASFDLSQLPPEILNVALDASNVATPNVTWQSTSDLSYATSGLVVSATWSSFDGETLQSGTWFLLVPSAAAGASPPALSDSVAAYSPAGNAEWTGTPGVVAFGGTLAPNYDVFRGFAGSVLASFAQNLGGSLPVVPPLPGNGTLAVSMYPFDY